MEIQAGERCSDGTVGLRAAFVVDCAKAANPMSDEEGEDLVHECARVASDIYCNERYYMACFGDGLHKECTDCELAIDAAQVEACNKVKR